MTIYFSNKQLFSSIRSIQPSVCVCVCVCARARARVCVCVCVKSRLDQYRKQVSDSSIPYKPIIVSYSLSVLLRVEKPSLSGRRPKPFHARWNGSTTSKRQTDRQQFRKREKENIRLRTEVRMVGDLKGISGQVSFSESSVQSCSTLLFSLCFTRSHDGLSMVSWV